MTRKKKPDAAGSDPEKKTAPVGKPIKKPRKKGRKAAAAKETADKLRADPSLVPGGDDAAAREKILADAAALLEAEDKAKSDADERNPVLPSIRTNPLGCAVILKARFFTKNGLPQVVYYCQNWYCYYEELWALRMDDDMDGFVHNRLSLCRTVDSEGDLQDFVVSRANVSEVMYHISDISKVPSHIEAPFFHLRPKPEAMDASGKMVTLGQITDMLTGEQWSNQEVFMPNGADWRFNAKAKEPKLWHKFLGQLFGDRRDELDLLQEWFGYVLSGDTWAQKGLILIGPKRAGKGVTGRVLKSLLGKSMVTSPALRAIGDRFGLEDAVDKRLCLMNDARLSNRQDIMAVIENLLRIIAGDPVNIDRKNKPALSAHELKMRVDG
ncbi:DUF5906 domain-containing protein [Rhodanobacter lindaniclasticus]